MTQLGQLSMANHDLFVNVAFAAELNLTCWGPGQNPA